MDAPAASSSRPRPRLLIDNGVTTAARPGLVEVTGRDALPSAAHPDSGVLLSPGVDPAGHRGAERLKRGLTRLEVALPSRLRVHTAGRQSVLMAMVIIGVDPHKRSATIEVLDQHEQPISPDRLWAVEGCNGIGRHLAQRLIADGEPVIDVPAKLSARTRAFATGNGRKTDLADAHHIAVTALRTPDLRPVTTDDLTVAIRVL